MNNTSQHETDFAIPSATVIANGALTLLRTYGRYIVFHGSGETSLAVSEREALELADPEGGDMFFPIDQLVSELSGPHSAD